MSRFIFYSGLAHGLAFVGVVGYMSTRPKEALPDFLQSKQVPHIEVTTSRDVIPTDVVSGDAKASARPRANEDESARELRDRKIRANLPTPPDTPRVVDKVKDARKVPTVLPAKKGASHIHQQEAAAPETGRDIPLETAAESDVVATAATTDGAHDDQLAEDIATDANDETASENLQIAAFDVDELAESHLQKLKAQEEREHLERMEKLKAEREAALLALAREEEEARRQEQNAANQNEADSEGETASRDSGEENSDTATNAGASTASVGGQGEGAGPSGGEVRALSEIRQRPGNQAPRYDVEDRRQGRQGLVVFLAYIKADGMPKEFQLAASSGHRSLDAKTLKALKSWKFQPGQEGWVEIPFQWDLKGGAQEAPSHLRRQGSR